MQNLIDDKKSHGFSLIEALVTLTIIAILSAMVIPLYSNHITHANRVEAELALSALAATLEEYNINNNTYKNAKISNLKIPLPKHYTLEITSATDTNFSLEARPYSSQEKNDLQCGTLTLNSAGEKGITGSSNVKECW